MTYLLELGLIEFFFLMKYKKYSNMNFKISTLKKKQSSLATMKFIIQVDSEEQQKWWNFDEIDDQGLEFVKKKLIRSLKKSISFFFDYLESKNNQYLLKEISIHKEREKLLKKNLKNVHILGIEVHKQYYTSLLYFSILGLIEQQEVANSIIIDQLKNSIKGVCHKIFIDRQLNVVRMYRLMSNVIWKQLNQLINYESSDESEMGLEEWDHQNMKKKINVQIKNLYCDLQLGELCLEKSNSFNQMCQSMLKLQYNRNERAMRTIISFNCFRQKNTTTNIYKEEQKEKKLPIKESLKQKTKISFVTSKNILINKFSEVTISSKKKKKNICISLKKISRHQTKTQIAGEQLKVRNRVQKGKENQEFRSVKGSIGHITNYSKGEGSEKTKQLKLLPEKPIRKERVKEEKLNVLRLHL